MAQHKPAGLTLLGKSGTSTKISTERAFAKALAQASSKEAIAILARRIDEVRESHFFGTRKPRTFREAATKFLE